MKIQNLLNESDLHLVKSRMILKESCDGLTTEQRIIVEGIYGELRLLIEASISADQIQQLFGQVEKSATAAGSNRTMLGKGVDTAKKANEIIDNIGKWLQDTTPVKMFDQKFEDLKRKINTKFPDSKVLDMISNMGIYAKNNPGKTAAIIGVLTTIAALAGGPVGGAIAGQVLKGAVELLKGEKLSTAIGKGAKAAAIGWLTGKAVDFIGNALTDPVLAQAKEMGNDIVTSNYTRTIDEIGGEFGNRFGTFSTGELYGRAADVRDVRDVYAAGVDAWKAGDYMRADSMFKSAGELTAKLADPQYLNTIAADIDKAQMMQASAEEMQKFFGAMSKVAQGAATAATTGNTQDKKESVSFTQRPLSEGQVYLVFNRITQLNEGPFDAIKGAAGKAANWVGTKGTNITTKITADKLNSAWQKAGSPTDSNEVAQFLEKQGVDAEIIKQVFTSMKLPAPGSADTVDFETVKAMITKLPTDRKVRLLKFINKQPQVA